MIGEVRLDFFLNFLEGIQKLTITLTVPLVHGVTDALAELALVDVLVARIHQVHVVERQLLWTVVLL